MTSNNLNNRTIYCLSFLFAFCSISYELLIANTISIFAGIYVLWQCVTIGIYMAALGLGAYISEFHSDKVVARKLFGAEISLSFIASFFMLVIMCLFSISTMYVAAESGNNIFESVMYIFAAAATQLLTLLIGFFSGYEIPLLIRLIKINTGQDRSHMVLASNYFGALAGTLIFSLWLYPHLDRIYTMIFLASLNMLICIFLVVRGIIRYQHRHTFILLAFVLLNVSVGLNRDNLLQNYLKIYYFSYSYMNLYKWYDNNHTTKITGIFKELDNFVPVDRIKTPYQYLDIVDYEGLTKRKMLTLNESFQFDSTSEKNYHETFAHMPPITFAQKPRKVLVLGAGDGLLIRELIKYDSIESITHIELDPNMDHIARTHPWLSELNQHALEHPKVKTIIQDAFHYVRTTEEKYDAIYIDFPYPFNFDLSKLYSIEFYRFVVRRLTDDGFFIIDCPLLESGEIVNKDNKYFQFNHIMLNTFDSLEINTVIPFKTYHETFIMAHKQRKPHDIYKMQQPEFELETLTSNWIKKTTQQSFPYEKNDKWVNSIFRPQIVLMGKSKY
jgi:spermidine synthase